MVKNPPANVLVVGLITGLGRFPGEGNSTNTSILVWGISWIEGPGKLQSTGSQRVRHDLATEQQQEKEGVNDSNTVIVGDFNNPHTSMDISPRQKINKETQALNDK